MPQPNITDPNTKRQAAREVLDILSEISTILNTHLDRRTLSLCISMIENGVNPEALAAVIRELRKERAHMQERVDSPSSG